MVKCDSLFAISDRIGCWLPPEIVLVRGSALCFLYGIGVGIWVTAMGLAFQRLATGVVAALQLWGASAQEVADACALLRRDEFAALTGRRMS